MVTRVSHWLLNREHSLQERSDYESVAGYCERDGLLRDEIQTRRSRGTLFEWQRRFCEPADGQWKVFSQMLKFFKTANATPTYGRFRVKNQRWWKPDQTHSETLPKLE